jgi:hypothetical protein
MGTRGSSLGVKRPGREADHSPPSSAEVNECSYTSTPQYAFMVWCLVKLRGIFTFLPFWFICSLYLYLQSENLSQWYNEKRKEHVRKIHVLHWNEYTCLSCFHVAQTWSCDLHPVTVAVRLKRVQNFIRRHDYCGACGR